MNRHYFHVVSILLLICSCNNDVEIYNEPSSSQLISPAGPKSLAPNFYLNSNNELYLTWIEMLNDSLSAFMFSTFSDNEWSEKKEITSGKNWFVNWADIPSMTAFSDHHLAAHYLSKKEGGTYAYDVHIVLSNDDGQTWTEPIIPHMDSTATEHGFVSLLPYEGNLLAIWLDGRNYEMISEGDSIPTEEMSLRAAIIDTNGTIIESFIIDDRVCSCCQTDAIIGPNGPILVYRDRDKEEIRDIYHSQLIHGKWTEPKAIHHDRWEIGGCPVNGPAIDALDSMVAVAWYTEANDSIRVYVAFSSDAGNTYSPPIDVIHTTTQGRLDITWIDHQRAVVSFVEHSDDQTKIKAQFVHTLKKKQQIVTIAETSSSRRAGFPMMQAHHSALVFAWTNETNGDLNLKTSYVPFDK